MTLGERIKKTRERIGMSQVDFADKVDVSKQTLYKYENNIITNIPSDKIERIAEVGNVSPAYLMGWEDDDRSYYQDELAGELAQEMFDRPELRVLFDASRKATKEDIEQVADILKKLSGK